MDIWAAVSFQGCGSSYAQGGIKMFWKCWGAEYACVSTQFVAIQMVAFKAAYTLAALRPLADSVFVRLVLVPANMCALSAEEATPGCNTSSSGFDGLGTGPRFGKGLASKPLVTKSDHGPHISAVDSPAAQQWPSVAVKAGKLPAHVPPKYPKVGSFAPGPGAYATWRDFDATGAKQQRASMGPPPGTARPNIPPPPAPTSKSVKSVRVRKSSWTPPRSKQIPVDTAPGPGAYKACDSSFCVCTNCEGIAQGKTFGTRPPVYTGNVQKPYVPGPLHYHVECTTLGAAAAPCDEEALANSSYPAEGLPGYAPPQH